jgi:hypothetical protein
MAAQASTTTVCAHGMPTNELPRANEPTTPNATATESSPIPLRSRRLKVGYAYTDPEKNLPSRPVPHLRLAGRWLKDAGFAIGQHVKIEVNEGRLTIEPIA